MVDLRVTEAAESKTVDEVGEWQLYQPRVNQYSLGPLYLFENVFNFSLCFVPLLSLLRFFCLIGTPPLSFCTELPHSQVLNLLPLLMTILNTSPSSLFQREQGGVFF